MSTGDKVGVVFAVVLVGLVAWGIVDLAQDTRARNAATDACWECGWGRVVRVEDEYGCYGWEDGAEVVRSVVWVQENACQ